MTLRVGLLAVPLVCATLSTPTWADAPTASGVAQGLFEEARDEMRRGDYPSACPKLAESERLDPSSGTLLNLVLCEDGVGKVASAWLHARELLDTLPDRDDRKPIAERKLAALGPRVPKLAVRLSPTAPAGTTVALDGVDLAPSSLGVPVPVDPGAHRLVVRAPGRPERVEDIDVREGQRIEWLSEVAPEAAAAPGTRRVVSPQVPPAAQLPGREPATSPHWERWAAFGVGAAGLVAGGILGAMAWERRAIVLSDCPAKQCKDASGLDAASEGQRLFAGALAATGVGLAGTGFGVYLVLRGDARPLPGSAKPSVLPSGVAVNCRLEF